MPKLNHSSVGQYNQTPKEASDNLVLYLVYVCYGHTPFLSWSIRSVLSTDIPILTPAAGEWHQVYGVRRGEAVRRTRLSSSHRSPTPERGIFMAGEPFLQSAVNDTRLSGNTAGPTTTAHSFYTQVIPFLSTNPTYPFGGNRISLIPGYFLQVMTVIIDADEPFKVLAQPKRGPDDTRHFH